MLVMQEDPDGEHQENVLATGMVANSRPRDNMTKIRSPRARPSPPQFFTMLAAASEGRMVTNPGGRADQNRGGRDYRRGRHFR